MHSFRVSCSQVLPVVPAGHKHLNSDPLVESIQVPPLRHGELSQDRPANWQLGPMKPEGQLQ